MPSLGVRLGTLPGGNWRWNRCSRVVKKRNISIRASCSPKQQRFPEYKERLLYRPRDNAQSHSIRLIWIVGNYICKRRSFFSLLVHQQDYSETTQLISMKCCVGVGHDPRKNRLSDGEDFLFNLYILMGKRAFDMYECVQLSADPKKHLCSDWWTLLEVSSLKWVLTDASGFWEFVLYDNVLWLKINDNRNFFMRKHTKELIWSIYI